MHYCFSRLSESSIEESVDLVTCGCVHLNQDVIVCTQIPRVMPPLSVNTRRPIFVLLFSLKEIRTMQTLMRTRSTQVREMVLNL